MWSDLKPYADLISVCGALVLFISWVVNNAIQERFKDAAASVVALRDSSFNWGKLQELSNSIESVGTSVSGLRDGIAEVLRVLRAPADQDDWDRERFEKEEQSRRLYGDRVNAVQIDHGVEFRANALRAAGDDDSLQARELRRLYEEMQTLRDKKDKMFLAADEAVQAGDDPRTCLAGLGELIDRYRPLLPAAVDAANALHAERQAKAQKLQLNAMWAKRVSLAMYAVGSLLVVGGQALSKL